MSRLATLNAVAVVRASPLAPAFTRAALTWEKAIDRRTGLPPSLRLRRTTVAARRWSGLPCRADLTPARAVLRRASPSKRRREGPHHIGNELFTGSRHRAPTVGR